LQVKLTQKKNHEIPCDGYSKRKRQKRKKKERKPKMIISNNLDMKLHIHAKDQIKTAKFN
jgi:hypothetical protein